MNSGSGVILSLPQRKALRELLSSVVLGDGMEGFYARYITVNRLHSHAHRHVQKVLSGAVPLTRKTLERIARAFFSKKASDPAVTANQVKLFKEKIGLIDLTVRTARPLANELLSWSIDKLASLNDADIEIDIIERLPQFIRVNGEEGVKLAMRHLPSHYPMQFTEWISMAQAAGQANASAALPNKDERRGNALYNLSCFLVENSMHREAFSLALSSVIVLQKASSSPAFQYTTLRDAYWNLAASGRQIEITDDEKSIIEVALRYCNELSRSHSMFFIVRVDILGLFGQYLMHRGAYALAAKRFYEAMQLLVGMTGTGAELDFDDWRHDALPELYGEAWRLSGFISTELDSDVYLG